MLYFESLETFLNAGRDTLLKGPIGLIFVEDQIEVETTIRHHLDLGFRKLVVLAMPDVTISQGLGDRVVRVDYDVKADRAVCDAVNSVIRVSPGTWFYYCYNAEYLFYPFCEHRSVGEMTVFSTEERRESILTYVIDLYAGDLWEHPNAVSIDDAHLDKSGYYALARANPETNHPEERQLNFFGGLRWRFEEHVPQARRRIDRIGLFKAKPGLELRPDHTFNEPEYNTYSCPWHNNLTASICSFRTAKALKRNPGSTFDIETFRWHNSAPFDWHSQQLLDLGLMEPGQWF
ncbi:hypothetical protein [Flavimaricola marinus]